MIISDLAHWDQEKHTFHPAIRAGIEYIRQTDFAAMEDGTYKIQGELMFAMLQTNVTQAKSSRTPESHEMYIDIQYLLHGEEQIGAARADGTERVSHNLLAEKDLLFYEAVNGESTLLLTPGMFAVFFPADLHRPCCSITADQTISKVVIKIHKKLWMQDGQDDT